jgi:hypothetical protein
MTDPKLPGRVTALEKASNSLNNHLTKIDADIETLRKELTASIEKQNYSDQKRQPTPSPLLVEGAPPDSQHPQPGAVKPIPRGRFARFVISALKWPRWKGTLQTIGIAGGVLVAVTTLAQLLVVKHNFMVDQRSWVRIAYKWPATPVGEPFQMVASLSNAGKSTINHLYAHGTIEIVDAQNEPSFDIENYHSFDFVAPMFPTDSTDWWVSPYDQKALRTRGFTQPELDGLNNGTKYLAVFGIVIYSDQFGLHWYRFCNWHSFGPIGGQVNAPDCSIWNRTGDGTKHMPYPDTYTFEKANRDKLP